MDEGRVTTETRGRETGPSPVLDGVWDAMDEVNGPDDPPITEKHVQEFIEALNRRGWYITLGPCRPHEWTDEDYCATCGVVATADPRRAFYR